METAQQFARSISSMSMAYKGTMFVISAITFVGIVLLLQSTKVAKCTTCKSSKATKSPTSKTADIATAGLVLGIIAAILSGSGMILTGLSLGGVF